jgi:peptide/nickel transport system ATP-binding protein
VPTGAAANGDDSDVVLDVRGLDVRYRTVRGDVTAVDGVDLRVNRGEILGIAGESGCGKSTLATTVLGLLRPPGFRANGTADFHQADGAVTDILGADETALRRLRWRHLSYLPQGSMNSLNPVMRIRDQFIDVMLQHGWTPDGVADQDAARRQSRRARELQARDQVIELLTEVGLDSSVAEMYPHELSGGMKQRVIIAMSVALRPELLIADEPTTALDVMIQRVVIQNLADLRDRLGVTMVVITHDMGVHAQLVDRVAVMNKGEIVEVGSTEQVFKRPADPYTQDLINSIPDLTVRQEVQ